MPRITITVSGEEKNALRPAGCSLPLTLGKCQGLGEGE
jgi:hypothetical protein